LAILLAVIGFLCFTRFFGPQKSGVSRSRGSPDSLQYGGKEFKMRKAYATFEDYKDDPNNLHTNELAEIERTMSSLRIPIAFRDRREFVHFLIHDLKFPGYGLSIIGGTNADDGSHFEGGAAEIPQRNKDRVVLFREVNGQMKLVDDFVFESATNQISTVKIEKGKLRYLDQNNRGIREKQLQP